MEKLEFIRIVQNRLHWAVTGRMAAKLISECADASKKNGGSISWKDAKILKEDAAVAKKYLNIKYSYE